MAGLRPSRSGPQRRGRPSTPRHDYGSSHPPSCDLSPTRCATPRHCGVRASRCHRVCAACTPPCETLLPHRPSRPKAPPWWPGASRCGCCARLSPSRAATRCSGPPPCWRPTTAPRRWRSRSARWSRHSWPWGRPWRGARRWSVRWGGVHRTRSLRARRSNWAAGTSFFMLCLLLLFFFFFLLCFLHFSLYPRVLSLSVLSLFLYLLLLLLFLFLL
mmetsp:Transcript_16974/g.40352  ORF Transcript_16974/g.40352 Transcript_16974/m.40352 type:complete len:216 (-) Transcript_16974:1028-1675(-)